MEYIKELEKFEWADGNAKDLDAEFQKLAKYFLTKGYFEINREQGRKIYICDVEFYYHEEKGKIKDYAMYHRNGRDKNNMKPQYFKVGQLNAHSSGVDITFENKDKEYRAGMLVRGFKIVDHCPDGYDYHKYPQSKGYDQCSTYFYDALLNYRDLSSGLSIKWVEGEHNLKGYDITSAPRINIFQYHQEGEKVGQKVTIPESSKNYIKCNRMWRFHLTKK
ncbi:MAG: hypothetical protein R3Y39_08405 [Rikenellaceae bacterium]